MLNQTEHYLIKHFVSHYDKSNPFRKMRQQRPFGFASFPTNTIQGYANTRESMYHYDKLPHQIYFP